MAIQVNGEEVFDDDAKLTPLAITNQRESQTGEVTALDELLVYDNETGENMKVSLEELSPVFSSSGTYAVTDTSVGTGTEYLTGAIIPSNTKKITILFDRIDTDGNRDFLIQLVTTTGVVSTNYDSYSTTGGNNTTSTEGFVIYKNGNPNPNIGRMEITRMGPSTNKWIANSHTFRNATAQDRVGAGILDSYTGTVNGLRITSATGGTTINLSGGTISIIVET